MDSISSLRSILITALSTSGIQEGGEQELFDELTLSKTRLLKVFDYGPRSPQEQRELDQGKIEIDSRTVQVSPDFARQVSFVSQQLNCSERYIATLLHSVLTENPTFNLVQAVEQAVLEYHRVRRETADCLRFIFEAADSAQRGFVVNTRIRLNEFAKRYLVDGGGEGSLAARVFTELENLGGAIADARIAVTNAVSNTRLPNTQGNNAGNLGQGVLAARLESLHYERRTLAFAFYFIARTGYLTAFEVKQVVNWLEKNSKSESTLYVLSSLFATLDLSHSSPGTDEAELRVSLAKDTSVVSFFRQKLAPTTEWQDASLKAAVQLKWTLFLTEVRFRDSSLQSREGFRNEDLEAQLFSAVQGDSFSFLLKVVSLAGGSTSVVSQLLNENKPSTTSESNDGPKLAIVEEFNIQLLHEIELLLRSLISHAPAELRKIKHKQEDQFRPRSDRLRRPGAEQAAERAPATPRNDIAILFQLLGQLYRALPEDSAIQYWGASPSTDMPQYYEITEMERGRLPSFLRWAVEVREADLIICVFDMLSGIAKGELCSECAYNFMATGNLDVVHGNGASVGRYDLSAAFTWGSIFGELESWAALGQGHRGAHNHPPPQLPIAPKDVLLGLAFLKLLATIATHSVQARIAIFSHPQYRVIPCLVSLLPLGVPLELKGALFDALSAFCTPGAGNQGVEICKSVWVHMDRMEVINVRGGGFASKGVEVELEEIESVHRVYPATIPFLELLSTLVHTPKRVPLKKRVTEPEPINTIPENLGQPYRYPGIGPYITFVIDNVLAKLTRREFLDQKDQWRMANWALCFLERCLASYDVEALPSLSEEFNARGPEVLLPFLIHPGFDVLMRILSDTPLRAMIISYTIEGSEELARQQPQNGFADVILRVMRIVDRVLTIQDLFLDQLVPTLSDLDTTPITGSKIQQSFLSRIDQGLSLDSRAIPSIGTYVNHPAQQETIYLAVKILTSLSQSPSFQNIASLIERSVESTVILDGFVRLLAVNSVDDVATAEEWADLWTGAGAPDLDENQDLFSQAIRLAILDLLLRGTKHTRTSSFAFLLLFGKASPDDQIQDPHALGSREYCLHIILHLLNSGVPRLDPKGKERERKRLTSSLPLFDVQPVLAERLYKLIYQLCEHPRTSSSMMLYLRTREDFFARHLAAIAIHTPADVRPNFIEVVYGDGSRVATTTATLRAFLQLRSWLLDLVSLELHILTNKGQHQRVKTLLDLLFGTTDSYNEPENEWEEDVFRPFNDISQSRIRLIEIFQSLEFEWFDSVTVTEVELQYFKTLNLQSCIRTDANGCDVVDRNSLFELLSNARRSFLRQGQIASMAHSNQIEAETKYILESCVLENNRREIQFARNIGYESWKKLVEVVLAKCFSRIASDQREGILFDLLHVLPPSIRLPTLPEPSAVLLAEVLLLLITKLREERRQNTLLAAGDSLETSALPAERMAALLRHILECVLDKNRRELVRGNLYAALTNFLHLVLDPSVEGLDVYPRDGHSALSELSLSSSFSASMSINGGSGRKPANGTTSLEQSSFSVIKQVIDRLVATVAKDAIDGSEVWKTVAFTLLESLARLSRLDSKHTVLVSLDRYGLLSNFIQSMKDADLDLQAVLRQDPDDLNPLFVYEAKMSFLVRLAQTRHGAERLLECRLLHILAQIDFLDARPEPDDSLDQDTFLPSALSRYHELLMPALQLVAAILATLGPQHTLASKQALDFIFNHRDTFIIMIKQEVAHLTLSLVEELDLITSICAMLVGSVPKTDLLATHTGFGGLHNAILGLASRTLGGKKWAHSIKPSDETEELEDKARANGYDVQESKFAIRVQNSTEKLRRSLLRYLSAASSVDDPELTVVLSPALATRREERPSGVSVPLPSLEDAVRALDEFCETLQSNIREMHDILAELDHRDHIRTDNIEEESRIVGKSDNGEAIRRLDAGQRRALVCRYLEKTLSAKRSHCEEILASVEMLLLLILRHSTYYSIERPSSSPNPLAQSQAHLRSSTLRFLAVPNAGSFKQDAASSFERVLEKLETIELDEEVAGRDWQSSRTYIEIMCRRLRESLDLGESIPHEEEN